MTTTRVDPLGLFATEVTAASPNGQAVSARLDLDRTDRCPVCTSPMKPILAAGIPSFVCWEHRVVLPQPDPVIPGAAAEVSSDTKFLVTQETPVVPVEEPEPTGRVVHHTL